MPDEHTHTPNTHRHTRTCACSQLTIQEHPRAHTTHPSHTLQKHTAVHTHNYEQHLPTLTCASISAHGQYCPAHGITGSSFYYASSRTCTHTRTHDCTLLLTQHTHRCSTYTSAKSHSHMSGTHLTQGHTNPSPRPSTLLHPSAQNDTLRL